MDGFNYQTCTSMMYLYLNVTSARLALPYHHRGLSENNISYATTAGNSLLFLKKTFYTYIFYSQEANLTEKIIFLEPISTDCLSCNLKYDPNLMVRLCYNPTCTPPLTNNSLRLTQMAVVTVALGSPEYLYKYDLSDMEVYENGIKLEFPVKMITLGTVTALQVDSCLLDEPFDKRLRHTQLRGACFPSGEGSTRWQLRHTRLLQ